MKVIDIKPKEISIIFDLSMAEINKLSFALSKSNVIVCDDETQTAVEELTNFAKMLNEVLESVKNGN